MTEGSGPPRPLVVLPFRHNRQQPTRRPEDEGRGPDWGWRARCSCGWVGGRIAHRGNSMRAWQIHYGRAIVRKAREQEELNDAVARWAQWAEALAAALEREPDGYRIEAGRRGRGSPWGLVFEYPGWFDVWLIEQMAAQVRRVVDPGCRVRLVEVRTVDGQSLITTHRPGPLP